MVRCICTFDTQHANIVTEIACCFRVILCDICIVFKDLLYHIKKVKEANHDCMLGSIRTSYCWICIRIFADSDLEFFEFSLF